MQELPLLSIVIPVAPNRFDRLRAILSRLTLNRRLFPDHTFEVIVIDGGSTDNIRTLCEQLSPYINMKYIYLPICQFINAAYPRNVGMRVCQGKVIGMIDVDHWPSEFLVYGMLNPFVEDEDFRFVEITQGGDVEYKIKDVVENNINRLNGQYIKGSHQVLNRGYVIDSSKSALPLDKNSLPSQLLDDRAMGIQILDAFKQAKIPFGVNNTLWTWAAHRANIIALNGYDEIYCRKFSYCYHPDVKALTKNGYKYIKNVEVGEEILTFNPENEQAEWQAVTQTHKCDYEGILYNFKNTQCDIQVTPNHRMLVDEDGLKEIQAQDITIPQNYRSGEVRIPLSSNPMKFDDVIKRIDFANKKFITSDLAEFLAYYVSEGHYRIERNNIQIAKDPKFNPGQHKRICTLIKSFGYHPSCSNHTITICNQDFNKFVSKQCGFISKEKCVPEIIWNMDKHAQYVFIETLMHCDGDKEGRYATTSKKLYDDLMRLAPTLGFYISENKPQKATDKWNECFILKISTRNTTQIRAGHLSKVPYKGKVYCVSVPNKFLFVLSNGRTMICGNSREDDDWRIRLRSQITGQKDLGTKTGFFDKQNKNFCAIHLYHDAPCRSQDQNMLNKRYFDSLYSLPERASIKRNEGWQWGKLLDYSFSIIDGKLRDPQEHEKWIEENISDFPNHAGNETFPDINAYIKELEKYTNEA